MSKLLKVFYFFTITIISTPLYAASNEANCNYRNRDNPHMAAKLCGQGSTSTPDWTEVLTFAQNPNAPPYSQGVCDGNGTIGARGGKYWCKEYVDTKYTTWDVVFDEDNDVKLIIRLSDHSIVEFDKSGTVIVDNTRTEAHSLAQTIPPSRLPLTTKEGFDARFNNPLYRHILPYAQKLGLVLIRSSLGTCNEQGCVAKEGHGYACSDYEDKYGKIWRVIFAPRSAYMTKIIRLFDDAMIEFNYEGKVIFNNTGVGPLSRVNVENPK